jgi:hypothetical protein
MKKIILLLIGYSSLSFIEVYAQQVDLEGFKKVNFKVTGGVNANSIYYDTDAPNNARDPFTYLLSGNINLSAFNFSVPLSYTFTNQGDNLGYTLPFNFNRLSLMPKYKWIKAYIGDSNMSFSPYTLNGHPFRGGGLELTPPGAFKISMMGGKLLKAIEATEAAGSIPVFERMGYGAKIGFQKQLYKIELIGFYAKDNIESIAPDFDTKGVKPKENITGSLFFNTALIRNVDFTIEYALSALSDDSRSQTATQGNFIYKTLNFRENTSLLKALKTNINYTIVNTKVGIAYERVDPNYQTLGSLFFNNDLENIAITLARPFFNDKINVSGNIGYQRDDLNFQKRQNTKRLVGSVNLNYKVNEKLNIAGSYSNFSTTTNRNLDQFSYINNANINPADTLNYRQLSQNAMANITYSFGKQKNQNLNFNYNIAGQANEQGGIIRKGQASNIQNMNLTHAINFKTSKIALNTAVNYTLNAVGSLNSTSQGGSMSVTKKMFNDTFGTNLGFIYNGTKSDSNATSSVMGIKLNTNYTFLKQHNFTLSGIKMFRKSDKSIGIQDLTLNFNYNYSFK